MKPSAIKPNNGITVASTSFIRLFLSLVCLWGIMLYNLESMTGDKNDQEAAARLERARALGSTGEARTLYRDWAKDYDADVFGRLKVTGTRRIAELLFHHLPHPGAHIIDLGCGTGAAGVVLKNHGATAIDGLDLSPEMLLIAAASGAYRLLVAADLLAPLPLRDHRYDAAISAGTFTTGHVGAAALPAIHRLIRPGGLLACVIARSFYESGGFADAIPQLIAEQRWRILHDTLEPIRDGAAPEGHMLVLQIN
jgi:ubiquinone/menaquinone biosynthesis C-methylase UbiE